MEKSKIFNNVKHHIQNKVLMRVNKKIMIIMSVLIVVILLASLIITSTLKYSRHIYNAGEYFGVAPGYHSDIEVKIITDKYRILQIDVIHHKEMPVISEVVFKDIPYNVIRENSTDVDIVSGATYTSEGLIQALNDAINKAKLPNTEVN